jgi:beta-phosphoglucomutase
MLALGDKESFLFDLDGTLIDSNSAHARGFVQALAPEYADLSRAFRYDRVKGLSTPESFRRLGFTDPDVIGRLSAEKQRFYREMVRAGQVTLFAGAVELLSDLRRWGKLLVLVTSASRGSAEVALRQAGIEPYFDGVVAAEDASAAKPDPALYRCAIERYRLKAASSLVVEDSESGRLAAEGAGMDVVLVHTGPQQGAVAFSSLSQLHAAIAAAIGERA